ncbi:TrbI/VirB10 family protein [Ruegeria sp.]|uniref:TrbI/VirB10 family protein n=1 Tax=Ruegeria sp. TaxID=1879320 RepID=UPI003B008F1B
MESTGKPVRVVLFGICVFVIGLFVLFYWQSIKPDQPAPRSDTRQDVGNAGDTARLGTTDEIIPGTFVGETPPPDPPVEHPGTAPAAPVGQTAAPNPPATAEDALRDAAELERLRRLLEAETEEILANRELTRQAKSSPIGESRVDLTQTASPAKPAPSSPPTPNPDPILSVQQTAPNRVQAGAGASTTNTAGQAANRVPSGRRTPGQASRHSGPQTGALAPADPYLARAYSPHRTLAAPSPFVLHKGTVIPGLLRTGINSETPGVVSGTVRLDVFDTVTGTHRLVPAGSQLFGRYEAETDYGQKRLGVVWTHLMFPDGAAIRLEGQSATDSAGQSGFADRRKGHFLRTLGGNLLYTIINTTESVAARRLEEEILKGLGGAPEPQGGGLNINIGGGTGSALSNFNRQQAGLGPTLIIRPGYPFNIVVGRDLVLEPR